MNCDKYIEDINLFLDGNLNKQRIDELQEHMKICESCSKEYEELKGLKDILGGLEMRKLPEGFEEELRVKLLEAKEEKKEKKDSLVKNIFNRFLNSSPKYKMAISLGMVAVVAVIGFSGLRMGNIEQNKSYDMAAPESAVSTEEAAMDDEYYSGALDGSDQNEEAVEFVKSSSQVSLKSTAQVNDSLQGFGSSDSGTQGEDTNSHSEKFKGRLIIKNADLSVEVDDFDGFIEKITDIVNQSNGYISNSSSYIYRRDSHDPSNNLKGGNISIRIPSGIFDGILNSVGELGTVTNTNLYTDDVSKRYRETADEVKNLEIREARIREIMGKAEKIEDILKIEQELARVRGDINRLKGNLNNWEDLVSLSNINIDVREVVDTKNQIVPVNKNVFQKAKEGFIDTINSIIKSIERFFIYLVTNLPILIPVLFVGVIVIRKLRKINIF